MRYHNVSNSMGKLYNVTSVLELVTRSSDSTVIPVFYLFIPELCALNLETLLFWKLCQLISLSYTITLMPSVIREKCDCISCTTCLGVTLLIHSLHVYFHVLPQHPTQYIPAHLNGRYEHVPLKCNRNSIISCPKEEYFRLQ